MFKGTREQVFAKAKRPILEVWKEVDCLPGEVTDAYAGLGPDTPKLVRTGRGTTAYREKDAMRLMRDGYTMIAYHLDVGQVYVHPQPVRREEIG